MRSADRLAMLVAAALLGACSTVKEQTAKLQQAVVAPVMAAATAAPAAVSAAVPALVPEAPVSRPA